VFQASDRLECQSCTLVGTSTTAFSYIRVTRVATTEDGKLHVLATTAPLVTLQFVTVQRAHLTDNLI